MTSTPRPAARESLIDAAHLDMLEAGREYRLTATMAIRYAGEFYAFDYPVAAGPDED